MENVDQDAHTTGETKRRDMTGHMHSRSPSSSSVSLFFFYLSLLYRDFFFALPYLSQVVFLKVFLLLGERLYRHLRAEPNLASHGGELKLRFFFFQLSTFNDMQQVKKKKTNFFSLFKERQEVDNIPLRKKIFREKKKSRMPSGGSTLLLPSDQKSAKKKRESQSKKEKKGQGQHLKQDPPLCLEGSPFLENDGIKKEKEKRPPNMEREEMSVSSFIRQNNRRGQVSERSLPRTISLLLLLLLVINPIIRDMRTTRQRDKLYRKVYSLVVTREPTAKTPIHPEMLSLRRRQYTDSFRERSRDFSFFVYVFARLSSYMIGREVWRAPCTTQPNKRNGFPATHRCSPFGTHT